MSIEKLLTEYRSYQETLTLSSPTDKTAQLSVFNGNKVEPIHQWFSFKEGFSAELFGWVTEVYGLEVSTYQHILDPFCGVATSLLSAQLNLPVSADTQLWGVEQNPFIRFVANTKLNWFAYDVERIAGLLPKLAAPLSTRESAQLEIPVLSTIRNPKVFSETTCRQLIGYRRRIERYCADSVERDFFVLGWSAIIERVSGVRRDGRALRFVEKKDVPTVRKALRRQWSLMLNDLKTVRENGKTWDPDGPARARVIGGDGRSLDGLGLANDSVDLIVYSPPYLNNIDYTEVYKLELWFNGFVKDYDAFRGLRLKTFRSHPSVKFPETATLDGFPIVGKAQVLRELLLETLPDNKDHVWRERLFRAYFDDLLLSLTKQFRLLKPGALAVCVVGNSMHGNRAQPIVVATDLFVAALAELAGFEVVQLQVTRLLRRRDPGNGLMRETVVVLRKP